MTFSRGSKEALIAVLRRIHLEPPGSAAVEDDAEKSLGTGWLKTTWSDLAAILSLINIDNSAVL
jgi:hypothetical protein